MTAKWVTGNTLDVLKQMPDNSIDLCLTSPPFLSLRSYLPNNHPNKPHEIGNEPTPGEFIDTLLDVTEQLRRVLTPHGSICVELGDSYSGSGGAGGDYNEDGWRAGQNAFVGTGRKSLKLNGWPEPKSLALIPESYRWALAYGRNPFNGRETPRWRVRNVVRWTKRNPPVGALGDKFRPATSDMVIACGTDEAGRQRYFDLDAVRYPSDYDRPNLRGQGSRADGPPPGQKKNSADHTTNPAGAPPLDWWDIPTHPYPHSHYATWAPDLCVRPIKAMCPPKVCLVCGQPSRRIVSEPEYVPSATNRGGSMMRDAERVAEGANQWVGSEGASASVVRQVDTLGWTDCGHGSWRTGRVLDPFGGSGTTGMVAVGHGRDFVGIDLDERNAGLARDRIGPMFFEECTVSELTDWLVPPLAAIA